MKRMIPVLMSLAFLLGGCGQPAPQGGNNTLAPETGGEKKLSIVSTIFPGYDFARAIAGDSAEVAMLLPPGAESHSFEPTPQDIIKIQNCDVFLYVGGDSDTWVDGILDSMDTGNMKIISMMDLVETVPEEIVEGMEEDHGHDHSHEIDPENIHDRPLSDWGGDWATIENALASGSLDAYITHQAEENETDFNSQKAAYTERWRSDYPSFAITGDGLVIGGNAVSYQYVGYRLVEGDHGASVWYGFEAADAAGSAPRFLAFNDHGTGGHGEDAHDEDHEDEHDEEHELAHFHMRYGDESFDALAELEDWAPTYFPSNAPGAEIAEAMGGHGHDDEHEYDEHVWTSPIHAITITEAIAQTLCSLDEAKADTYLANAEAYVGELKALDAAFREVVQSGVRKTLIFGDRFPFRYFVDEYGLTYYAAFPGCATETEASAQTVAFLIDKVKEESIPVVFYLELSNEKMADTICEATGANKLLLHSCHNVTKDQLADGATYLELMTRNVEALKEALS